MSDDAENIHEQFIKEQTEQIYQFYDSCKVNGQHPKNWKSLAKDVADYFIDSCTTYKKIDRDITKSKQKENFLLLGVSLSTLPPSVGLLTNLTKLSIVDCRFFILPKEIGNLQKLETLYISRCPIVTIPDQISELKKLQSLTVNWCRLKSLPSNLHFLGNLKSINVKYNMLEEFPNKILSLKLLTYLDIQGNDIELDWNQVSEYSPLQTLNISETKTRFIPDVVADRLFSLHWLYVDDIEIPSSMKNIRYINLSGSSFKEFPDQIFQSKHLKTAIIPCETKEKWKQKEKTFGSEIQFPFCKMSDNKRH